MPVIQERQKWASAPLEIQWIVVRHPVHARNINQCPLEEQPKLLTTQASLFPLNRVSNCEDVLQMWETISHKH